MLLISNGYSRYIYRKSRDCSVSNFLLWTNVLFRGHVHTDKFLREDSYRSNTWQSRVSLIILPIFLRE